MRSLQAGQLWIAPPKGRQPLLERQILEVLSLNGGGMEVLGWWPESKISERVPRDFFEESGWRFWLDPKWRRTT